MDRFLRQLYKYFCPELFFIFGIMLKTYFIVAWRNLRKNKVYSTINITGADQPGKKFAIKRPIPGYGRGVEARSGQRMLY